MKNRYSIRLLVIVFLSTFVMSTYYSCPDDGGEEVKIYEYHEQIGKKIKVLTNLQAELQFELQEEVYPETSRTILEDTIARLRGFLQTIKEAGMTEARIPEEITGLLKESDEKIAEFKVAARTEDSLVPAELEVSGKNDGYISFGAYPEYSTFGEVGKQVFTVKFWAKLRDVEGFFYLVSTSADDNTDNHERKDWCVNSYNCGGSNTRMIYGIGFNDLIEPAFGFATVNKWVHLVVMTDETRTDGEANRGKSVMTKMYMNGELKLPTTSHQDASKPYASNDSNVPAVAFGGTSATGSCIGDKDADGNMKHLHIQRIVKTRDKIRRLVGHPESVMDEEDDLVCKWTFTKMALDDQEVKDLAGGYTVKLVGDYRWTELE